MIFRPFYRFETGCAAYVFGCGGHGVCRVVGPHEAEVDAYIEFAKSKEMRLASRALEVHPAHFSGSPCGAGLSGKPMSTIDYEKRWNPLLGPGRDAFVDEVGGSAPTKPAGMDEILRFNQGQT